MKDTAGRKVTLQLRNELDRVMADLGYEWEPEDIPTTKNAPNFVMNRLDELERKIDALTVCFASLEKVNRGEKLPPSSKDQINIITAGKKPSKADIKRDMEL